MLTPDQTKRIEELRNKIAPYLTGGYHNLMTAAYILECQPEVEKYDLSNLVYLLARGEYGCHKNDIIGVVELIEKNMENENEAKPKD